MARIMEEFMNFNDVVMEEGGGIRMRMSQLSIYSRKECRINLKVPYSFLDRRCSDPCLHLRLTQIKEHLWPMMGFWK